MASAGSSGNGQDNRYAKLIEVGIALSAETNHDRLLEMILLEAKQFAQADGGTLYLRISEDHRAKNDRRMGVERRHGLVPSEEEKRSGEQRRLEEERRLLEAGEAIEKGEEFHDKLAFAIIRNDTLKIAMGGTTDKKITFPPLPLYDLKTGEPNHNNVATHVALSGESVNITDAYEAKEFDFSGTRKFDEGTGYRSMSFLTVPLKNHDGVVIGVLQLINAKDDAGKTIPFSPEVEPMIQALTSQAAVALDNQNLIEAQKKLLESFIEMIAGAIDAKSPYTGGHCQRVPDLTLMLAHAACESSEPPFADFDLTEEEFYELHIAGWLHDCGKVTTPEYVVDKATKLETIYNRIHEIRTRFEVIKRDVEIDYYKGVAAGGDEAALAAQRDEKLAQLDADYEFIAESNVGGEFLDEEKVARIHEIGARTWQRSLSARIGLSQDELGRKGDTLEAVLPVTEHLLSDKDEHIIPWGETDRTASTDEGFRIDVPENKFNLGEKYNLSISRGTLTDEERYKINDHIVQTIRMLNHLPFPDNMKRVPEYAGGHHETLIGTGYPRKLKAEDMSLPARLMAVADIFEALTARDRPYKKAKTLSEAIKIMGFMVKDQHIDPDIFRMFLEQGVYKDYADKFLDPSQMDEVDISPYIEG